MMYRGTNRSLARESGLAAGGCGHTDPAQALGASGFGGGGAPSRGCCLTGDKPEGSQCCVWWYWEPLWVVPGADVPP